MKNIYEVFDEFESVQTEEEKIKVIEKNLSDTLYLVLKYTFHPDIKWKFLDLPEEYKIPDSFPGISYCRLSSEIRKMYLFQDNNPNSLNLSEKRRKELLLQFLESLEPREAEVIVGIFRKDQKVEGLTYEFVKKIFPNLLP